jgi:Zn-finger nucleic acid-binding protein
MERVTHLVWHAERCAECKGLWFDMTEYEPLKGYAEEIDIGDAHGGEVTNEIDHIDCPVCAGKQPLIRMVDPQQPHIWFESCKNCYGRFYDAGEFRDFAEHDFHDLILDWKAKPRD